VYINPFSNSNFTMKFDNNVNLEQKHIWLRSVKLLKGKTKVNLSQQLVDAVENALGLGEIEEDEFFPSINQLSSYFEVSRWTIENMLSKLIQRGVIQSVRGKGYFVLQLSSEAKSNLGISFKKSGDSKAIYLECSGGIVGHKSIEGTIIYDNNDNLCSHFLETKSMKHSHSFPSSKEIRIQSLIRKINTLSGSQLSGVIEYVDRIFFETEVTQSEYINL
jgi:DNA-binding transcriptional regulator YhcF (GntR family)